LNEALKALESVAKIICKIKKWEHSTNANSKTLIGVLFTNGLIPKELQTQFNALQSTLEAGSPTIRNKKVGHGQGHEVVKVPEYLAAYALHLTASAIVFMVEASQSNLSQHS
jgi:hypothetical protein